MPPHVLATWQVRYLAEPWDEANRKALAWLKYEPPGWLQKMLDDQAKREKARRGKKYMTADDIRRQYERSQRQ